jgi:hypothetical protein
MHKKPHKLIKSWHAKNPTAEYPQFPHQSINPATPRVEFGVFIPGISQNQYSRFYKHVETKQVFKNNNKYTGGMLKDLRKERGIGRPPITVAYKLFMAA